MKKILLTCISLLMLSQWSVGQEYLDDFDDGVVQSDFASAGFTTAEADGEWTINGDGSSGAYDIITYYPAVDGERVSIDVTGNNKLYVRAKASSLGTQIRMDLQDEAGYATTLPGITKTMVNDYVVFEFDYGGNYADGGYGGTSCDSADAPCPVDGSKISQIVFYINPGVGAFAGSVVLDYIAVGSEPSVGPMSSIFQDHFDNDYSLGYMNFASPGLVNIVEDSKWVIRGDGTNGPWDPVNLLTYNTTTLDTVDISVVEGNDKVFMRMRSSVPGTSVRLDAQDINSMVTTAGSITKVISEEWTTYEYNFAGSYQDLAYGGTGCTVGPCPVDGTRISNFIVFVNPGVEAFVGDVEIDYISVGTSLENDGGENNVLAYGDHFSDNANFVNTSGAYELSVTESTLSIVGNGVDAPYSSIAYSTHDDDTGGGVVVDATGNNKLFVKARCDAPNTLLRIDLVDTAGYVTTLPSFTRLLDEEYSVIELDFTASYTDGGYGGSACEEGMGPCDVDGSAIGTILFYPNPADGGFEGKIDIDYVSFGAPLGEDVFRYTDEFDNDDRSFWSDAGGFTVEEAGDELTITGDGTAGAYAAFNYQPHNAETGEAYILDVTSNNKVYVRAKSTVEGTPLRIDLLDEGGFATTEPATIRNIGTEYSVLEFDFSGTYNDGGYGGTSCDPGPCPVDGTTVANFLVYIDPDVGGFNGTVTLDWFTTIEPLPVVIDEGPVGQDDYSDEFSDNLLDYTTGIDGIALSAEDGLFKMIGDGTSGLYAPVGYKLHEGADSLMVNASSNDDKLYIRAISTVPDMPLRIDLQDNKNFHTTQLGATQVVGSEFSIIEYNYAGGYTDGGFGGTACDAGPCPVDPQRIEGLQFYINPGIGEFNGEIHIDWVAFGEPLEVNVVDYKLVQEAMVFPNPASDQLFLHFETLQAGNLKAQLYDLTGRLVSQQNLGNIPTGAQQHNINIDPLQAGMYYLSVSLNGQNAFFSKIIVE